MISRYQKNGGSDIAIPGWSAFKKYFGTSLAKETLISNSYVKDQGSRIKDRMIIWRRFRLWWKSPFSAYSRPLWELAAEYQREYCRKMQPKREKQNSNTHTGDPLQRAGSELKNPGHSFLNRVISLKSRISRTVTSRFSRKNSHFAWQDAGVSLGKHKKQNRRNFNNLQGSRSLTPPSLWFFK